MKKIFLTVDTESHNSEMENQYIWGKKGNKEYGLRRILELGKEYKIPVNFFVDFAEERRYGRAFLQRIVNAIQEYNQPIFLHLHPNFISRDERRTYLWEYSKKEQLVLVKTGIEIFSDIVGEKPVAFRAGRYGINEDTYEVLNELLPEVLEFSYTGGYGKMCHVGEDIVKTKNHYTKYKNIRIMPNCSFVALDMFGFKKSIGVDTSEMSLTEFEEFIQKAEGKDFVLTMHSWNFINRYFWNKNYVGRHRTNERLFAGIMRIADKYGYEFTAIDKYDFENGASNDDIKYNSCDTPLKKIRSIGLNFWRFQQMAKISKKYLYIYIVFYGVIIWALLVLGKVIFIR